MLVVSLLAFVIHWVSSATDYCERDLQCTVGSDKIPHSMCNPQTDKMCLESKDADGSDRLEDEVLNFHNVIRSSLSAKDPPYGLPRACPLRALEWDPELAKVASNWAVNHCSMTVDPCCSLKDQGRIIPVGQNIAVVQWLNETPKTPLVTILGYWWRMMGTIDKQNRGNFMVTYEKGMWDPAVQMIRKDTRRVGCAYVQYDLQNQQGHYVTLVCNYVFGGNTAGTKIYDKFNKNCPNADKAQDVVKLPTIPPTPNETLDVIVFDSDGNKIFPLKLNIDDGSKSDDGDDTSGASPLGYTEVWTKLSIWFMLQPPFLLIMIQQKK